jgi:hypothetical protein
MPRNRRTAKGVESWGEDFRKLSRVAPELPDGFREGIDHLGLMATYADLRAEPIPALAKVRFVISSPRTLKPLSPVRSLQTLTAARRAS